MVSHCCCGDLCNLKNQPADKHWCPGCKQAIHGICGIPDETQESIAYMNWCHACHAARKMPALQVTEDNPPSSQEQTTIASSKKKPPPQYPTQNVPLQATITQKQQLGRPNRSSKPFKIVAPALQVDPLIGRQVAFPLEGSDQPKWLNNPVLQQYGEEIGGVRYLLGNVSRSKSTKSKTPYLIEWEATKCGRTPMDHGTVMTGVETAVQLQDKNHPSNRDANRKRYPLSSRLREKLFEVAEDEIGQYLSSDEDSNVDDNDDESIYEPQPPAKSSIKNHFMDLHDIIDTGFQTVPLSENATLVDEIDVVEDGLRWKIGGTVQPPLNVSRHQKSRLKTGSAQHFTTPLSSFLSFVPLDFWKLWVYETNRACCWNVSSNKRSLSLS